VWKWRETAQHIQIRIEPYETLYGEKEERGPGGRCGISLTRAARTDATFSNGLIIITANGKQPDGAPVASAAIRVRRGRGGGGTISCWNSHGTGRLCRAAADTSNFFHYLEQCPRSRCWCIPHFGRGRLGNIFAYGDAGTTILSHDGTTYDDCYGY